MARTKLVLISDTNSGKDFYVNPDQVDFINDAEGVTPLVAVMVNGSSFLVSGTVADVADELGYDV